MRTVLEIKWPKLPFTVTSFANYQWLPGSVAFGETFAHSPQIFTQIPISGKSRLPLCDRTFCDGAKSAIIASRSDFQHFIILEKYKPEEIFLCEFHRAMTVEAPQSHHIIAMVAGTQL